MIRFQTTRWSIVQGARGDTAQSHSALDALCRTYRPPVLAYVRSRGYPPETAEDLTQSFFVDFIERASHAGADPERGRFRAFLLVAIKRFLINADEKARTQKRGGTAQVDSLKDNSQPGMDAIIDTETPERAFERSWALAVLDSAMRRLRAEADAAGKGALFMQLREFLAEAPVEAEYERAARALNLRRNTLAVAVHRLRHRLRELVRAELAQTTTSRVELEAELRELRATLADVIG